MANETSVADHRRTTAKERAWIAEMDAEPAHLGLCYFAGWRDQVKIGFSTDVDRRLDEIRCKFLLDQIELLAVARGHRYREAFYHKRFAAHHLHNEWFARCPEIEAEIERLSLPQPSSAGREG